MKSITGYVVTAEVTANKKGITIGLKPDSGKMMMFSSTIEDSWLKIPEGKDAETELQKVCDLLTGYHTINGERQPIVGFMPKKLTIENQE